MPIIKRELLDRAIQLKEWFDLAIDDYKNGKWDDESFEEWLDTVESAINF